MARLRELVLWVGAVLGLLSVVAGTAVMFFGFTFLVFRSGSMGPEIPTGSLALARTTPAADLEIGDVVSLVAANGERVTHRLVSSTANGEEAALTLKGDANDTADAEIYLATEAERSIVSVPYAGYVVTVLLSPAGLVAVGCLSGILLLMGFAGGRGREGRGRWSAPGGRHRSSSTQMPSRGRKILAGSMAASLVAVGVASVGHVQATSASFNDRATVTTGAFSMRAAAAPVTNVRCAPRLTNTNAIIRWDAPVGPAPSGYRLNYTSNAVSGFVPIPAGVTEGHPPVPDENGNRTYTVTITALYNTLLSPVSTTSANITGRNSAVLPWNC